MLDDDQDDRGERHDPEQFVAELRTGRHIGDPVARVDEADRDKEAGADIAEQFHRGKSRSMPAYVGEPSHGGALYLEEQGLSRGRRDEVSCVKAR
jgi:hypothetical protein